MESVSVNMIKDLGGNKYHDADYYWYSGGPGSATVSNLVYNSTTGILTGNYTLNLPATSSEGDITISNGTFSTKLSNVVSKMAAQ